jgi:hypothetical protein
MFALCWTFALLLYALKYDVHGCAKLSMTCKVAITSTRWLYEAEHNVQNQIDVHTARNNLLMLTRKMHIYKYLHWDCSSNTLPLSVDEIHQLPCSELDCVAKLLFVVLIEAAKLFLVQESVVTCIRSWLSTSKALAVQERSLLCSQELSNSESIASFTNEAC